jgi:hypothetical protein
MPLTSTLFRSQSDLTHRALPLETAPLRYHHTNTLHLTPGSHLIRHPSFQMTAAFLSLKVVSHTAHPITRSTPPH